MANAEAWDAKMLQVGSTEIQNQACLENMNNHCPSTQIYACYLTMKVDIGGAEIWCTTRILNVGSSCDDVYSAPCFMPGIPEWHEKCRWNYCSTINA